jgi:hypothetical protein
VKKEDIAYTSPSTAENQKESENVYAKEPRIPENIIINISELLFGSPIIFFPNEVIVQKRNIMVKAENEADIKLIMYATLVVSPKAKLEKKFPSNKNVGAPGGCPTCSLYAVAIYSPQSQKLVVGSSVST